MQRRRGDSPTLYDLKEVVEFAESIRVPNGKRVDREKLARTKFPTILKGNSVLSK